MVVGIDPGAKGAFAALNNDGDLLDVVDMPSVDVAGKPRVSAAGVATILNDWKPRLAVVERTGAMPGQGVSSMYAFGYSCGLVEGACAMASVPLAFVQPATWKKAMRVTADKGSSRLMAQRLWPRHAALFARVRDDGRAEAALIGFHGRGRWHLEAVAARPMVGIAERVR